MSNFAGGNAAEAIGVVATIDPASYSAGSTNTDVIDMKDWAEVLFIVQAGALGASATLDFVVKGDTASGGSYATTITGKSITQMVKATDDNKQRIIRVTAEEVAAQGLRYLRGTQTVATAASLAAVTVIGVRPAYSKAGDFDLSSVD